MAIRNPSFEDAGAAPGEAAHWTMITFAARERIAGFGPAPHQAWEDFERWFAHRLAFAPGELVLAFFAPRDEGYEAFEAGWANGHYLTELLDGQVVAARFGSSEVEDMEKGWGNDSYVTAWENAAAVPALFGGTPVEGFEAYWHANQAYAYTWTEVVSIAARFGGDAESETFDSGWTAA